MIDKQHGAQVTACEKTWHRMTWHRTFDKMSQDRTQRKLIQSARPTNLIRNVADELDNRRESIFCFGLRHTVCTGCILFIYFVCLFLYSAFIDFTAQFVKKYLSSLQTLTSLSSRLPSSASNIFTGNNLFTKSNSRQALLTGF